MKAILYPYDQESLPILTYGELLNVDIKYCVYPSGESILSFKNILFDDVDEYKMRTSITEDMLNEVEALCIVDSNCDISEDEIIKTVSYVAKMGKSIIIISHKCKNYIDKIVDICKKSSAKLYRYEDFNKIDYFGDEKMETDVPIITVMGMLPSTQKFELQLHLYKQLTERGYRVSQVGCKPISGLFGFHAMPDFIYTNEYSEKQKITFFSNYIKNIESEEKPDVIIVGIPDAIIPFSSKHNYNYGIYAFEILSAIEPDFSFLNLSAGKYNDMFFDEIMKLCHYKYNVDLDAFFISKYSIMSNSVWSKELSYASVAELDSIPGKENVFTFCDFNSRRICDLIEKKLKRYGRFEQY